jgi:hypothetical protein
MKISLTDDEVGKTDVLKRNWEVLEMGMKMQKSTFVCVQKHLAVNTWT